MKKFTLFRFLALVAAMMCALGAAAAEAYACYTPGNTTLTFYYDNLRNSRTGTTYSLNTGSTYPAWYTDGTNAHVTKVVFHPSFDGARPTTTGSWFQNMENLQSITGMSYLNTSEATYMAYMFYNCSGLTSIDLSHFNTAKVTIMRTMFGSCQALESLDLSSFNTSQVTNMEYMFNNCTNLRTIYADNGWNTTAVTYSSNMFNGCTSLVGGQGTTYSSSNPKDKTYAHIDGGTSNPGYFTDINAPVAYACYTPGNTTLTFYYDNQRNSRPGTTYSLNTGTNSVAWYTDGTYAHVTQVVFDPSFDGARPTSTFAWFLNMTNLQSITGMEYLNTSEVTNMSYMFYRCQGLTSLDLMSFNTLNVIMMNYMFAECSNLQTINVNENWTTAAVTQSAFMFTNCTSLVGGQGTVYDANHVDKTYAHIDGGPSNPGYFTDINAPVAYACYTPGNTTLTFYYDNQRSSRPGTTYDLNTGTDDTGWDTDDTKASVTQVVFDPSFANARPTTTCDWFYDMRNLESITGLKYLNTSEVTNMAYMFLKCSSLTSLDVSHFNTSKVTNMYAMFSTCGGLTSLDLSSFNTSMVNDMAFMFKSCSNLRTVYVGDGWSTAAVTSSRDMFEYDFNLVGGMGTAWYGSNPMDKTYAHIDGGPSNPGYFTEKGSEAYACYTPENTTLTFYCDNQRTTRPGTTYDLNEGANDTDWDTDRTNDYVTKVVFDPSFADVRPTTTYDWFYGMTNLESITGIEYLNTSEVTDMGYMFAFCSKMTSFDVSHFNTSQVTSIAYMFYRCDMITSLDLSNFNTANVTNTSRMIYNCPNLTTVYVGEEWSTEAVTNSSYMFHNVPNLVGGQGTTYNESNPKDKTYAHIDGGPSNPGYFSSKSAGLRGDVNGDNNVTISDVTALINYLLTQNATGVNLDVADCNQDHNVTIGDVTALIAYLLSGNWN